MEHKAHYCRSSQLKVGLVLRHFGRIGGLEKYGHRLAQAFVKKGVHVQIVTSGVIENSISHPLIHFQKIPVGKWPSFIQMEEFDRSSRRWLETRRCDVIFGMDRTRRQTHIRASNGVHRAFLKQQESINGYRALFKRAHLSPLNRTILNIEKKAFESPELKILFTNSHMVKREILSYYKTPNKKIHVFHNGVEWNEMGKDFDQWLEKKPMICKKLGLNPSSYHFLFIGNGFKRKGLRPLLEALSVLPFEDFHLSVIGKDKNSVHFMKLAKHLGLADKVSFFGPCLDVRPFYQYGDALVIPSFYDPFANVTVEALAMGLFVVTSKTNGGCEILKPENGVVIQELQDPHCLAETLKTASLHPKTWIRSQNIRQSVKYLDFSDQLASIVDLTLGSIGRNST